MKVDVAEVGNFVFPLGAVDSVCSQEVAAPSELGESVHAVGCSNDSARSSSVSVVEGDVCVDMEEIRLSAKQMV